MAADQTPITADETRQELDRLTGQVIGAAQRVSSVLGEGFLEKIYENALVLELKKRRVRVDQQCPVHVRYEGEIIGDRSRCVNYLRATGLPVCLLLNFGCRRLEVRRIVHNY